MTVHPTAAQPLDGDPVAILRDWVAEATSAVGVPATMTLATTSDGEPHARTVVVTAVGDGWLTFHSSTPTAKSRDLRANPRAAGVFYWPALGRQVVLAGDVMELSAAETAAAYPTRPRQLQLLAWVYEELGQGLPAPLAEVPAERIRAAMAAAAERDPATLPAPASWTTFRVDLDRLDFWQAGSEVVAPTKTRFLRTGAAAGQPGAWTRTDALP